jgi:hypothetical protein
MGDMPPLLLLGPRCPRGPFCIPLRTSIRPMSVSCHSLMIVESNLRFCRPSPRSAILYVCAQLFAGPIPRSSLPPGMLNPPARRHLLCRSSTFALRGNSSNRMLDTPQQATRTYRPSTPRAHNLGKAAQSSNSQNHFAAAVNSPPDSSRGRFIQTCVMRGWITKPEPAWLPGHGA